MVLRGTKEKFMGDYFSYLFNCILLKKLILKRVKTTNIFENLEYNLYRDDTSERCAELI